MVRWLDGQETEEDEPPAPPPELVFFFHHQALGDPWAKGWMAWPAKLMARWWLVRNVYNAYSAYERAEDKVEWTRKNPAGNKVLGEVWTVIYGKPGAAAEPTPLERWEDWLGPERFRHMGPDDRPALIVEEVD